MSILRPVSLLARKSGGFSRLPLFVKAWIIPASLLLVAAKILIVLVSFRRLAPMLGDTHGVDPFLPVVPERQRARVRQIGTIVNIAARHLPLGKDCYPKSILARLLLGIYGIPYCIFFGVRKTGDGIEAHAWVYSGGRCICGGRNSFRQYKVVNVISNPGLLESAC